MKPIAGVAISLLCSVLTVTDLRGQSRTSDEAMVRSLDDQERRAALNRDVASLDRLWSDEFVVNAPNNQVVVGKRAVLDTFVASGIINFSSFEMQLEFVRIDGSTPQ